MKVFSTMLVTVTLLVIGFLFLLSGTNNAGSDVSESSVRRMQSDQYHSQFKRRDFIRERRENERKEISREESARQIAAGRYHDDFMAYNRQDSDRNRYDGFRQYGIYRGSQTRSIDMATMTQLSNNKVSVLHLQHNQLY